MRLKVVSSSKEVVLSVGDDDSLEVFIASLQKEGLVSEGDKFNIKFGFPSQAVDIQDKSQLLRDLGIRSGDKLTILHKQGIQSQIQQQEVVKPKTKQPPSSPHARLAHGYLLLVEIPDDNSCLFRSITTSGFQGLVDPAELRSVVADTIRENKDGIYNDVFLGKPRNQYLDWIIKPTSWGGAIEIDILSKYLGITINSIDVGTGRVDSFNSDADNFIIVLYTGIHYDTVAYIDDNEYDPRVTNFIKDSELGQEVLQNINKLATKLNHKGYVTNTSTFKIKCKICNTILKGEREASQHASETMHYEFGEV